MGALWAALRERWTTFWHTPVRAERLAFMRILLGVALLTDQVFQYWPHFEEFFGPTGVAPEGLHDWYQLGSWEWTVAFFNTDNRAILDPIFWTWVSLTALFTAGLGTRVLNVAVWFLTMCFINRNGNIQNGGDDTMQVALFLLMLSPSGRALSIDAWLRRRWARFREAPEPGPAYTPAWPVRLIQIQLAVLYCTTGLVKLKGTGLFEGTWWDGTSVHYVLNYVTMSRWSYAQLPVPFWITAPLSYLAVWWEALFPLLVLNRWTRRWALWFGVLFHLGIWLTIEVGWFSFYTWVFYGVWVPDRFWARWDAPVPTLAHPAAEDIPGVPGINVPLR
jgi:uncharacterized membrane protein YphA (DoxX/SURF4 family)